MNCQLVLLLLLMAMAIEAASFAPRRSGKWKQTAVKSEPICGYASCPVTEPDKLNIHLVSHSHDDVGWLKTVDEYFYGDKNFIQIAGVQYILDTVIDELNKDSERRFIYVETSYFWRWWNSRDDDTRNKLRSLVESGRLEFIGGGWSMNDEAGNHYVDTVDQMTWGLRFLNDTLGECARPRVAWQIDPFGHSRETASLFAQMGYDGLFFGRLDYQDKDFRKLTQTMEFLWNASANLGVDGQLFTGVLPNGYNPPSGFCFDNLCGDEPIQDNPDLKNYNVEKKVDLFLKIVADQAAIYRTNHLIMTMGSDFHYQNARPWFLNLDKLIKYVNERQTTNGSLVNVFYSTPSCYLQALNEAGKTKTWTVKTDDFFPYASDPHAYWTGYFTSRPALKGYIKYTNNILQVAKQLSATARLGPDNEANLEPLKRYQGDAQHHDAVSGTAKQAVTYDYAESLAIGVNMTTRAINAAYAKILPSQQATRAPPPQFMCHYLNVSYCDITESSDQFAVTVYNPLGHSYEYHVRVPIRNLSRPYEVIGDDGSVVPSQVVPVPMEVRWNPEHQGSAIADLYFAVLLEPLGHVTYFVRKSNDVRNRKQQRSKVTSAYRQRTTKRDGDIVIQNTMVKVTVDGESGLLKRIDDLANEKSINISQSFSYYVAMNGDNQKFDQRASGAYIFRPNGTTSLAAIVQLTVHGPIVQEIHQNFGTPAIVSQVIRIRNGSSQVELEWQVGPIPIDDGVGKEIVSRFDTDLNTDEIFYTDSNGREILQRRRNYRPTWQVNVTEPVSGNYYPVNSRIYIKDEDKDCQLTVLTDRSQGGSSLEDGSLELMVHRRLLHDDAFGVDEALNETGPDGRGLIVRGKHQLLVTSVSRAATVHRPRALTVTWPPLITFAPLADAAAVDDWRRDFVTRNSSLTASLPCNVHLLTLEPWKDGTILLRLEHYLEKTDDPGGLSEPVTVNLRNLFREFTVTQAVETTLGANLLLADLNRFSWKADDQDNSIDRAGQLHHHESPPISHIGDDLDVTLQPMQIRTFIITPTPPDITTQ